MGRQRHCLTPLHLLASLGKVAVGAAADMTLCGLPDTSPVDGAIHMAVAAFVAVAAGLAAAGHLETMQLP